MKLYIKEIMIEKGVSPVQLAEALGKPRQYVTNVCNGDKIPSLPALEKIALALGVSTARLLEPGNAPGPTKTCSKEDCLPQDNLSNNTGLTLSNLERVLNAFIAHVDERYTEIAQYVARHNAALSNEVAEVKLHLGLTPNAMPQPKVVQEDGALAEPAPVDEEAIWAKWNEANKNGYQPNSVTQ